MTQDFDGAIRHFSRRPEVRRQRPALHQNLALTYELQGDLSEADPHWNRYFDLLDQRMPAPSDIPDYLQAVGLREHDAPGQRLQRKGEMVERRELHAACPSHRPKDAD